MVQRAGDEVKAHPDAYERQANPAVVKALVAQEGSHHRRTDRQQPECHRSGENGDGPDRDADRAAELVRALVGLKSGQVGEDRGLYGLKQL